MKRSDSGSGKSYSKKPRTNTGGTGWKPNFQSGSTSNGNSNQKKSFGPGNKNKNTNQGGGKGQYNKSYNSSRPKQFGDKKPFKKSYDSTFDKKRKRDDQAQGDANGENKKPKFAFRREREAKEITVETLRRAKQLWEKGRNTTLEKADRDPALQELYELVTGHIQELIFKHDASRMVQTSLKFSNQEKRTEIIEELKGKMVELSKSHYGHFLAAKALKYSSAEKRKELIKEYTGSYVHLSRHKDASVVVETIYRDYSNGSQKADILLEFYGQDLYILYKDSKNKTIDDILKEHPGKKETIITHLSENINAIIDKGGPMIRHSLVHHLMVQFLTHAEQKRVLEMIPSLAPLLPEILHTKDGAKVGVICVSYSAPKDRKIIIKALKGLVVKACMEECGHVVILRLLDCVDDTVLMNKTIIAEMLKDKEQLIYDTYGRLSFLHILAPKAPKYFPQATITMLQPAHIFNEEGKEEPTSKKPMETRQQELLSHIIVQITQYCTDNVEQLIKHQFGGEILIETLNHMKDRTPIFTKIAELATAAEDNIMEGLVSSRNLKRIIKSDFGSPLVELLANQVKNKTEWATKKGASFIILSLLENPQTKLKVEKELKPNLAKLQKSEEPGCKIIVDILKGVKKTPKKEKK